MNRRRPSWDFDEFSDYIKKTYTYNNTERNVFVKDRFDPKKIEKHTNILFFLDKFTLNLQEYVKNNKLHVNNKCLKLFNDTKHTFYELYPNPHYNGVNKPKNVHECENATENIGPDEKLRAHTRHVMIIIPDDVVEMFDLYCHEIAHTLCNHVQFRPDDHHGDTEQDFPYNQKLVRKYAEELNFFRNYPSSIPLFRNYPSSIPLQFGWY